MKQCSFELLADILQWFLFLFSRPLESELTIPGKQLMYRHSLRKGMVSALAAYFWDAQDTSEVSDLKNWYELPCKEGQF